LSLVSFITLLHLSDQGVASIASRIHKHTHAHTHTEEKRYIVRERERERERERGALQVMIDTM